MGTANSYDAASHPARTTMPDGKWAEYTYDGLGRQVTRRTDSGETTLVFHFGLVDQPAVEQTTGGPEDPRTTRYLLNSFGAPLGQQVTVHAGPDVVSSSYFVPDLRGNLSQLLGSNPGSASGIKGIFGYDAYGKAKQDLDTSGNPTAGSLTNLAAGSDSRLRYQMAPHDPLTGNYNLGPRLLNPNINRFVGADFYAAGAANMALQLDPLTGNRYMYAGANPAGLIDDGHGPFDCDDPKSLFNDPAQSDGSCIKPWEVAPETVLSLLPGRDCFTGNRDGWSWGKVASCALDIAPIAKLDDAWAAAKGAKNLGKASQPLRGSGPVAGVLEASSRTKSVRAINNWNGKSTYFVFDPKTQTFAMGRPAASAGLKGSDHQKLAKAIGADEAGLVGGTITRAPDGKLAWTEQSGHYFPNWNDDVRRQFVEVLRGYGVNI